MRVAALLLIALFVIAAPAVAEPIVDGKAAYAHRDYQAAMRIFMPLAERGDVEAQRYVASMYWSGKGVERDLKQTYEWLHKAAKQGDPGAQYDLMDLCSLLKCNADQQQYAVFSLIASAQQGNAPAQDSLGYEYETKHLDEPNHSSKAAVWYRKAADQGNAGAQGRLADLYRDGKGVPQDYAKAYFWSSLAIKSGNTWGARGTHNEALKHLTLEQMRAADNRIKEWKPNPTSATKSYFLVSDTPPGSPRPVP